MPSERKARDRSEIGVVCRNDARAAHAVIERCRNRYGCDQLICLVGANLFANDEELRSCAFVSVAVRGIKKVRRATGSRISAREVAPLLVFNTGRFKAVVNGWC